MNAPTGQDEGTAPDRGGKRRRQWLLAVLASVVAGFIVITIVLGQFHKANPPTDFPIKPPGGKPVFVARPTASGGFSADIKIASVSADGRWVALTAYGNMKNASRVYFDVEQKRSAGALLFTSASGPNTRFLPAGGRHWTPESIVIAAMRLENSVLDAAYYELNARERKMRFLAQYNEQGNQMAGKCAMLSPDRSRVLYSVVIGPRYADQEYRIRDLNDGTEQVLDLTDLKVGPNDLLAPWDWLPDNRTVVFLADNGRFDPYCLRSICLADADGREPLRQFPVLQWLQSRRPSRSPAENWNQPLGDVPKFVALLGIFGDPPTGRLAVRFQTSPSSSDPATDRASIWNVDLETGQLSKVLDLPLGIGRNAAILVSPSGNRFLTAPDTATIEGIEPCVVSPILYEIEHPPRRLSIQIPWSPHIDPLVVPMGGAESLPFPKIRFLDDETLIYIEEDDEVRRLDLRTGQSESLGTVERKRLARNGAW